MTRNILTWSAIIKLRNKKTAGVGGGFAWHYTQSGSDVQETKSHRFGGGVRLIVNAELFHDVLYVEVHGAL